MAISAYQESFEKGLKHVNGWASMPTIPGAIENLSMNKGSREGSLATLIRTSQAYSMLAIFRERNISEGKKWASIAAKLQILRSFLLPGEIYLVEDLLWPLISDNEELIDWYCRFDNCRFDSPYANHLAEIENPKSFYFYRYQSFLALNGRWTELADRSRKILAMSDQITKDRSYLIDHEFYLALSGMELTDAERVLTEKVAPKARKSRYEQQSGMARDFMDTYATLFAKLAWRRGLTVAPKTPWIFEELLPVSPLAVYEDPWPFLADFDIWQPLSGSQG
jgi:hypothetical protein